MNRSHCVVLCVRSQMCVIASHLRRNVTDLSHHDFDRHSFFYRMCNMSVAKVMESETRKTSRQFQRLPCRIPGCLVPGRIESNPAVQWVRLLGVFRQIGRKQVMLRFGRAQ